jgi:hypothetical protein
VNHRSVAGVPPGYGHTASGPAADTENGMRPNCVTGMPASSSIGSPTNSSVASSNTRANSFESFPKNRCPRVYTSDDGLSGTFITTRDGSPVSEPRRISPGIAAA